MDTGRFAPTTSGRAHPGTLLAGLLAWLDVRSRGGRFLLRLEDIDPTAQDERTRQGLLDDLCWFGLDWDDLVWQSSRRPSHEAALDRLASLGVLYECGCSRTKVKAAGLPSVAGGWVYPGTCRTHRIVDWRSSRHTLRVDLSGQPGTVADEDGVDLSQDLARDMGDPVVRRADGGITYQLAVVVDDAEAGVTRVVRGRDLASSTATQVALRRLLELPIPIYRHHLLLLEPQGTKLAKLHQSIGADVLRQFYQPAELVGFVAGLAGLGDGAPVRPAELVPAFSWSQVQTADPLVRWDGHRLGATVPDR